MTALKNNCGLTLIEIAVVVTITGLLVAIATPTFVKHLPGIRLKGDARDVVSVLRLARMRAIAEGARYGVHFDDGETPPRYIFFRDEDHNEIFSQGEDTVVFTKVLYKKTRFSQLNFANDAAIFEADGSSNGGSVTLGLMARSDSLMVDVLPSTGRVKVIQ